MSQQKLLAAGAMLRRRQLSAAQRFSASVAAATGTPPSSSPSSLTPSASTSSPYRPRPPPFSERARRRNENRRNPELERLARTGKLDVPLLDTSGLSDAEWLYHKCDRRVVTMATHFNIFGDLFQGNIFPCRKNLVVKFGSEQVHRGNVLDVKLVLQTPAVKFEAAPESSWALALFNADGRLDGTYGEVLHWLIGNIKGSDVESGQELLKYLPLIPLKDAGWNRYVFVLFEQQKAATVYDSLTSLSNPASAHVPLSERYVSAAALSKEFGLVPQGLAFCQIEWSKGVSTEAKKLYGFQIVVAKS